MTACVDKPESIKKAYDYTLNGENGEIDLTINISDAYFNRPTPNGCDECYKNKEKPLAANKSCGQCFQDYINDPISEQYIEALAFEIQNKTSNDDDQLRIAISMVQHIPYDTPYSHNLGSRSQKYPVDVLYTDTGVCQEKSLLLAAIAKKLGYNVSILTFYPENHMTVGIATNLRQSWYGENGGYTLVETNFPAITTMRLHYDENFNNGVNYLQSQPIVIPLTSSGKSWDNISTEMHDAQYTNCSYIKWKYGLYNSYCM